MRKINKVGLDLIKKCEGCRLSVYVDQAGHKTVGYGHKNDQMIVGHTIAQWAADQLLIEDLRAAESAVLTFVKAPLTDNQFAALVSLVFNIGGGNFKTSHLCLLLNDKDYAGAAEEFPKWRKSGGKIDPILVKRRAKERELFLS